MSYKLVVSFTGMCLFVPAPNDDSGKPRMHVLLPQMDAMGGMPAHFAKLFWDRKYEGGSASGLNAGVDLSGEVLDLTSLGATPAKLLVWPEIAPADIAYGGKVDKVKTQKPAKEVRTRVSMQSGEITGVQRGDVWTMPIKKGKSKLPVETRMAWWAEWTIDGLSGQLPLQLTDANGNATTVANLTPVGDMIQLYVYHVPASQLPPNPVLPPQPAQGTPAPHFPGFKTLLTRTTLDDFTPTYEGPTADPSTCIGVIFPQPVSAAAAVMKASASDIKGEQYTCMLGQSGIG